MKFKKSIIRTIISLLLITLILSFVDVRELANEIKDATWWMVALVVLGYFLGQSLNCFKWYLIATHGGIKTTFPQAFKAYFTGMFANSFGLGVVGGDLTRALLLSKEKNSKSVCLASVVADRAHGLSILAAIGFAAAMIFGTVTVKPEVMKLVVAVELLVVVGWFFGPWLLKRLPVKGKWKDLALQTAAVFPHAPLALLKISAVSFIFHLLQIGLHALIALALKASVPFSVLLVVIPFVNMLATLPISWNGLGVRESGYLFFLTPLFLNHHEAVAFGAIWLLAVTINSALGGVIASIYGTNKIIKDQ